MKVSINIMLLLVKIIGFGSSALFAEVDVIICEHDGSRTGTNSSATG